MSEKMITIHGHTIKGAIEMPLAELKRLIAEAEAPPPPTFQVGQWVRPIDEHECKAYWGGLPLKVIEPPQKSPDPTYATWTSGGWTETHKLRLATPEEIAAATRIQPKVGMLLKRKSDDAKFQLLHLPTRTHNGYCYCWRLDVINAAESVHEDELTTENFDILPRYTVQGVQ